jgi:hypothetical protein
MDTISGAIVAALSAGVTAGLSTVAHQAVVEAYQRLKALLIRKFGAESDLAKALAEVEKKPDSEGRQKTLAEEVAAAKATEDAELVRAAEALLELVRGLPDGARYVGNVQIARGRVIGQALGPGAKAIVTTTGKE